MNEFEIIEQFFLPVSPENKDVLCDIGDDAAVVRVDAGNYAISTDTLVESIHFPKDVLPENLGYKVASVTLSDLAAIGAIPKFATVALTMPEVEKSWLKRFTSGLSNCLGRYGCLLIGGDTTRGPLVITLQAVGFVEGKILKRSGAKVGDLVGVTGYLGDARAALDFLGEVNLSEDIEHVLSRYFRPTPRLDFSTKAQKYINSAIDISDGLIADLEHLAHASKVRLEVDLEELPVSSSLNALFSRDIVTEYAASGGDDYELAFTVPEEHLKILKKIGKELDLKISVIGKVVEGEDVVCLDGQGNLIQSGYKKGYRHF